MPKIDGATHAAAATPPISPSPPCRGTFRMNLEQPASGPPTPPAPGVAKPAGPLSSSPSHAPSHFEGAAKKMVGRILADERAVDRGLAAAMSGKHLSSQELIVLQAKVIQYSQELEVASRLVEKGTSAIKQTMTTQV